MGALFATPSVGDLFDCAMRLKCFKHSTRFGAPIRVCQFGYGRVGPTWHTSKMLKSTEHDGVDKFLHIVHLWARAQLPSWFHWCSVQVAQYCTTTPMLPHCHPKDHSPLSAVLEGGDFEGGGLWVAEGGLLLGGEKGRKTKCATKVCSGCDVVGGVHPARRGVIFSSSAFHCPAQWTGDRWSIVLFNGGNIDGASQDSLERLDDLGFKLPCGLPCGGWNCGVNTCN